MLTVVIFKGRNVPSALSPARIAEILLCSVVPPVSGSSQIDIIAHSHGDMAVLQMPLSEGSNIAWDQSGSVNSSSYAEQPKPMDRHHTEHVVEGEVDSRICMSVSESFDEGECPSMSTLSSNVSEWDVNDVLAWMCQFEPLRSKVYEVELRKRKVRRSWEHVQKARK